MREKIKIDKIKCEHWSTGWVFDIYVDYTIKGHYTNLITHFTNSGDANKYLLLGVIICLWRIKKIIKKRRKAILQNKKLMSNKT